MEVRTCEGILVRPDEACTNFGGQLRSLETVEIWKGGAPVKLFIIVKSYLGTDVARWDCECRDRRIPLCGVFFLKKVVQSVGAFNSLYLLK